MFRFLKPAHLAAVLVGITLLAGPGRQARADWTLDVFDDGKLALTFTGPSSTFAMVSGATPHFNLASALVTSTYPGFPSGATMGTLGLGANVSTAFASGGTHTLEFVISETGFTAPQGNPMTLSTSAGGSMNGVDPDKKPGFPGDTVSITTNYTGYLDNGNGIYTPNPGIPPTYATPAGGATPTSTASNSITGSVLTAPLVYSPGTSVNTNIPGGTTQFALTMDVFYSVTTTGDEQTTFGSSVSLAATAPAPATMVAAFTALPFLGLGAWMRRRKLAKATLAS